MPEHLALIAVFGLAILIAIAALHQPPEAT